MNTQFDGNVVYRPPSPTLNQTNGRLPYHWDGECHLVFNEELSYSPRTEEQKMLEQADSMDFELGPDFDLGPDIPFNMMDDYMSCESESLGSAVTSSTANSIATILEPKISTAPRSAMSLDAQLDFIMETTKKPPKAMPMEKKCKRSRKTPEQLMILGEALKDLEQGQTMGKKQVAEIATKTGLTEMKVYKWFWDRGYKLQ